MLRPIHAKDKTVNLSAWRKWQAALTTQGRLSLFEQGIWPLNQLGVARLDNDGNFMSKKG